jgi:hypothetical protein
VALRNRRTLPFADDASYKKLKARIAPNMATALANMTSGCEADTSLKIDPP